MQRVSNNVNRINGLSVFFPIDDCIKAYDSKIYYNRIEGEFRVSKPRKAKYFSIVLFEKGSGYVQIDDTIHTIQKNKVIVVFPGQVGICFMSEDTLAHHLMVREEVYEAITSITTVPVRKTRPISSFDITNEFFELLRTELLAIQRLIELRVKGGEELIFSRFRTAYLILKTKCMNIRTYSYSEVKNPIVTKFIELIENNYKTERRVEFYAEALRIQSSYLTVLCQSSLEISAKQVIKNRLIQEAKRLLVGSDLTIKEITYELQIGAAHFSNFFKIETGFLPKEFIKLRAKGL